MRTDLLFLLCVCCCFSLQAQETRIDRNLIIGDTSQTHFINTVKGDRFVGTVTKIENNRVFFTTSNGLALETQLNELSSLLTETAISTRIYIFKPSTRNKPLKQAAETAKFGHQHLFFSPTAFNYEDGKGEYRNLSIFFNEANFKGGKGLTFSTGIFGPLLAFGRAKLAFPVHPNVRAGLQTTFTLGIIDGQFTPYLSGIVTIGNPDYFVNISGGWLAFRDFNGFTPGGFGGENERAPYRILSIGGGYTLNARWRLKTEVVYAQRKEFPNFGKRSGLYTAFSFEWFAGKNSFNFGLAPTFSNDDFNFPFPILGYARQF